MNLKQTILTWMMVLMGMPGALIAASVVAQGSGMPAQIRFNGDGTVSVSFQSTPGVAYQVQSKSALLDSNWNVVADGVAATANSTEWTDKSSGPAQRFYRVLPESTNGIAKTAAFISASPAGMNSNALAARLQSAVAVVAVRPAVAWHVDKGRGNDAYDGRAAASNGTSGPFATIAQALSQAQPGDSVEVAAGTYPENVNLAGRPITFNFNGTVILH